jgi:hypothetical protein
MSSLERLREIIRAEGEPLASALRPVADAAPVVGALAASGPRAARDRDGYELLVEAIYEGYLLHYEHSRLLASSDPNLALLAGDRLYALGLERLVELGDLEAVGELADVISLCALLHARGEPALCREVWLAGARAVGYGASAAHAHAKQLLLERSPGARAALASVVEPPALA